MNHEMSLGIGDTDHLDPELSQWLTVFMRMNNFVN